MKNEKLVLDDFYQAQKWSALNALRVFDMGVIKNVIINNEIAVLEKYFYPMVIQKKPIVSATTDLSSVPNWVREFIADEKEKGEKDIFAVCYYNESDNCHICYFEYGDDAGELYNFMKSSGAYRCTTALIDNQKAIISTSDWANCISIPNENYCYSEAFKSFIMGAYDKFNFVLPVYLTIEDWEKDKPIFEEQAQKLQEMRKSDKI